MELKVTAGSHMVDVPELLIEANCISSVEIVLGNAHYNTRDGTNGVVIEKVGGRRLIYITPAPGISMLTYKGNVCDIMIFGKSSHRTIAFTYNSNKTQWRELR